MNKVVELNEIKHLFKDGMSIMIGGFMGCGTPHRIIDFMLQLKVKNLTVIGNDTSFLDKGIGRLIASGQVRKVIASHIGTNPETGRRMNDGTLEVELVPQGTLIERIRAAGSGLGGVLTPTGIGTVVEEGKQKITVEGREYLLELPLRADLAIIRGTVVDEFGNTFYKGTTKNFNPIIAFAGERVIAEAGIIVKTGELNPDYISTPGVLVDYIVKGNSEDSTLV
jgi:acetate CoA/acetoacetate CoA-transferase alpha subunit